MNCPTEIELGIQQRLRVTLFDANHCPGAVMFLIEGDGKAILYTGDIRAEPWWINQLIRNPVLIPYSLGDKRLDRIYLDTTFAIKADLYREFPSKADGLQELLLEMQKYPPSQTVFYFRAYTLGYEEVWQAMSALLHSQVWPWVHATPQCFEQLQVHVDEYQHRLYGSLSTSESNVSAPEAPLLNGFQFGNGKQEGCLTKKQNVSIHSCEPGTDCHAKLLSEDKIVWIFPIVTRTADGLVVPEVGAGGGRNDLSQIPELDATDSSAMTRLEDLCSSVIDDPEALETALSKLFLAKSSRVMSLSLEGLLQNAHGDYSIQNLVTLLASTETQQDFMTSVTPGKRNEIRFPYSRHSSYSELRHLVASFNVWDIYPCTSDKETWVEEHSIENLFGDLCSGHMFHHDRMMRDHLADQKSRGLLNKKRKRGTEDSDAASASSDIEPSQSASYETTEDPPVLKQQQKSPEYDLVQVQGTISIPIKEELADQERPTRIDPRIPRAASPPPPSYDHLSLDEARATSVNSSTAASSASSASSLASSPSVSPDTRLHNIKEAYLRLKQLRSSKQQPAERPSHFPSPPFQTNESVETSAPPASSLPLELAQPSSPITPSTAFFDSQPSEHHSIITASPITTTPPPRAATAKTKTSDDAGTLPARKAAYRAARTLLTDGANDEVDTGGDGASGAWELYATRSGGNSHTKAEVEL